EALRAHPDTEVDGFPRDIMTITEGLNKISTIKPKDTRLEAERYKKLIMAYSTDPRVTVIKIADRLEVMRHLQMFPKVSRDQKLLETLLLYIPLAHQLGLYNIKSEMEDIYFRFAEPEQHRQITRKLKAGEKGREQLVREFIHPLEQRLAAEGIKYKLKTRTKTAYSIYKKMLKQQVPFEGVYDVFAIRFIIKCDGDRKQEADLCWKVYSYVTEEYEADTERLRDWITQPKDNGYESLHITVKNKSGNFLEVQIRTERMDDIAENGLASHWSYKGIKGDATLDSWLKSVRYHLEHPLEASSRDEIIQPSDKEIFVFTPTGELRILPAGASVLDFAFNIHTGLGCHCTGARIGGRTVPIKEKLSTGDVVEILSNKNQRPSQDWLNWVISSKARSKIKLELDADLRRSAAEGRELLERRLKNWKMALPDELLAEMMHYLKYSSVINFMADVGYGKIDVNDIKAWILDPSVLVQRATPPTPEKKTDEGGAPKDNEILVINARGVKGLEYKMAPCCHPVYGDKVFGFVTRSEGIKIHREDCPNAPRLKAMYPYRVQKVVWAEKPVAQNLSLKPGKK
ncbi:MAG: bifunctional (p)ppGpp synthetase/guanosine-3',5'-bis(diphosphate) 3'-pyrophosphohydrolase, partial [Bacteroidales bacterium]|nr:bifunctional (p)ppGpp synthetase/guanosine-3',5'-bis(diphosphate) 3'-pyrophosphohydrolase [Bacteroidales bacterium]